MGAAVASLAVASTAANVNHLVLESPFNNLADEVSIYLESTVSTSLFRINRLYLPFGPVDPSERRVRVHVGHWAKNVTFFKKY